MDDEFKFMTTEEMSEKVNLNKFLLMCLLEEFGMCLLRSYALDDDFKNQFDGAFEDENLTDFGLLFKTGVPMMGIATNFLRKKSWGESTLDDLSDCEDEEDD